MKQQEYYSMSGASHQYQESIDLFIFRRQENRRIQSTDDNIHKVVGFPLPRPKNANNGMA